MTRHLYSAVTLISVAVLLAVMPQSIFAADEHGGGQTSLNPLEWASNTAFWSLVIFVIVFALLGKFAFRPIAAALDAREQGIADKIAAAARLNEEAKDLMRQYQDKLDASRDEVRQIMETAKKDAQRVADTIVEKANAAAVQERERSAKEIESATASALQTIAERSASLATNLAGRMIRAEVKPEQHRDLINAALQDFVKS
ncbi:MAG: F0F1 ATP synthase subunit B [Planctomycetaceae bacterium]|jgi:F-type H+-transporting ATPase subunit b|nr:F0F1 ATP synthase subunit B [Planctomycetaceae bacterium]